MEIFVEQNLLVRKKHVSSSLLKSIRLIYLTIQVLKSIRLIYLTIQVRALFL